MKHGKLWIATGGVLALLSVGTLYMQVSGAAPPPPSQNNPPPPPVTIAASASNNGDSFPNLLLDMKKYPETSDECQHQMEYWNDLWDTFRKLFQTWKFVLWMFQNQTTVKNILSKPVNQQKSELEKHLQLEESKLELLYTEPANEYIHQMFQAIKTHEYQPQEILRQVQLKISEFLRFRLPITAATLQRLNCAGMPDIMSLLAQANITVPKMPSPPVIVDVPLVSYAWALLPLDHTNDNYNCDFYWDKWNNEAVPAYNIIRAAMEVCYFVYKHRQRMQQLAAPHVDLNNRTAVQNYVQQEALMKNHYLYMDDKIYETAWPYLVEMFGTWRPTEPSDTLPNTSSLIIPVLLEVHRCYRVLQNLQKALIENECHVLPENMRVYAPPKKWSIRATQQDPIQIDEDVMIERERKFQQTPSADLPHILLRRAQREQKENQICVSLANVWNDLVTDIDFKSVVLQFGIWMYWNQPTLRNIFLLDNLHRTQNVIGRLNATQFHNQIADNFPVNIMVADDIFDLSRPLLKAAIVSRDALKFELQAWYDIAYQQLWLSAQIRTVMLQTACNNLYEVPDLLPMIRNPLQLT